MFILRQIFRETGIDWNKMIGQSYQIIHKEISPEMFNDMYDKIFAEKKDVKGNKVSHGTNDDCYALLESQYLDSIIPLYKSSWYYIMTGDGKTFENISYK